MTDNPFEGFDSEDKAFIKHDFEELCWYRGKEKLDVNYFYVEPTTMLMGWGAFSQSQGYSWVWQKDLFSPISKPETLSGYSDYKKAFSVWLLPKYVDGKQNITQSVALWQRNSFGEFTGFKEMGASFYAELQKPENKDKLPVVKWTGSETLTMGMGKSTIPHFELAGFRDRPVEFVIPDIGYDTSPSDNQNGESQSDNFLPTSGGDTQESHPVLDTLDSGDIPF